MTSPRPGYSSHFGINNIPFGIASSSTHPDPACVTRINDNVIFLDKLSGALSGVPDLPKEVFRQSTLNAFAALSPSTHQEVRRCLQSALGDDEALSKLTKDAVEAIDRVTMHLPVDTGDFTDFSCSHHHVQNAAEAMTGKRSAPPAFFHMPIGYAGRCSSLDISGTPVERPIGQFWAGKPGESDVVFGPCKRMDYELELGCIVGRPLARRDKVLASNADEHIFGYVLVNDWSARDIQALEMIPLGPVRTYVILLDVHLLMFMVSPSVEWQECWNYYLAVDNHDRRIERLPYGVTSTYPEYGSLPGRLWTRCLRHQATGASYAIRHRFYRRKSIL